MRDTRRWVTTAGLIGLALLPMIAAVESEPSQPARVPVAIAQPLAALESGPLVTVPPGVRRDAALPEPGVLVLVGGALMGLASVVRRTTRAQ